MIVTVHRGTHQIGGSVVEIATSRTRIILDLGSPLPDENGHDCIETLAIEGVTSGVSNCDAVLFSHYHGDHIGMLGDLLPGIPFYLGPVSKEIYLLLQKRIPHGIPEIVRDARTFTAGEPLAIGDLSITPFMVDHSAFDAYMFLIEAESKRVLYTGDFRTHGFRGKAVLPMLRKYVGQVDVLITEGTMLSRGETEVKTEQELQAELGEVIKKYKYIFVICSSTNIDRIGSICQATPRGKYFLCDPYQKTVLEKVSELCGQYSPLYQFKKVLNYGPNLDDKMKDRGFCMLIRNRFSFPEVVTQYQNEFPDDTVLIYSMWRGYLDTPNSQYKKLMEGFQNIEFLHTSGHATKEAIMKVCQDVNPKEGIIPVHSEASEKLDELGLGKIIHLKDGEEYETIYQ